MLKNPLYTLLTIPEVARVWERHYGTVHMALGAKRNPLIFRKTDRVYLVTYESCVRRWGEPVHPEFIR